MATQRPSLAVPLADFAAALLAQRELTPRAQATADQVAALFTDAAVVVYVIEDQEMPAWAARGLSGEVALHEPVIEFEAGPLGAVGERREPLLFSGDHLKREDYAHLNVRRTVQSLAYLPILAEDVLLGAVEIISYDQPLQEAALHPLTDLAEYAAIGIAIALAYESERNAQLESITRVTQMYDLEKVFNATLEMEELLELIPRKFHEILPAQAINLWMVDGESLLLTSRSGYDGTCELGTVLKTGEGLPSVVADSGEPLRIEDPQDERLGKRNGDIEEGAIFTMMAAPLMEKESLVGVVEVINRNDGVVFDEDDEFLLINICQTAANALHNANLLQTERKVEILETLVNVSRELSSTLNLDAVLQAVVNGPNAVIPYERAAIALDDTGRLKLKAISGMTEIRVGDQEAARLSDMLQWASLASEDLHIVRKDGEISDSRPETRAKFEKYFTETGMNGFYALTLADEQGRVGVLSLESSDPDFLTPVHIEMLKVLGAQATVALRNASLYKEVPFIGVLEPLIQRKRKFQAMEKWRRNFRVAVAVGALVLLVAIPFPMRVDGIASVAPARTARIQPEIEGVVKRVLVREGAAVRAGDVIAEIEDWDYRASLGAAEAKRAAALADMNRALAGNDSGAAGSRRIEAEYWAAEVLRARERLERTRLRSPIDGIVATPYIENLVGRKLEHGDVFAEIVDSRVATVDVAVDEGEIALLQAGRGAAVKLQSFPTRTFRGQVEIISPASFVSGDHRVFYARVAVPNEDAAIRPGMEGNAKLSVGWRPVGYVMFRGIGRWAWGKLWNWFGW